MEAAPSMWIKGSERPKMPTDRCRLPVFMPMDWTHWPQCIHVYSLGVQPCLNYGAHAIDLSTTELRALDTTHSNLIKWSLGLSKFCRSTPLLRALGVQRIPAMRDHQSVNLLKRCLAGLSAASTFYWSLIHTGTLMLQGR